MALGTRDSFGAVSLTRPVDFYPEKIVRGIPLACPMNARRQVQLRRSGNYPRKLDAQHLLKLWEEGDLAY